MEPRTFLRQGGADQRPSDQELVAGARHLVAVVALDLVRVEELAIGRGGHDLARGDLVVPAAAARREARRVRARPAAADHRDRRDAADLAKAGLGLGRGEGEGWGW